MERIEEIIKTIDDKLIETGKDYMLLAQANKLLVSKKKISIREGSDKILKKLLEDNRIAHAYQTKNKTKQWRIPLSEKGINQKMIIENEKKEQEEIEKEKLNDNYYLGNEIANKIICPKCNNAQTVVKSFREKKSVKCPFCGYTYDNPITSKDKDLLKLILYSEPFKPSISNNPTTYNNYVVNTNSDLELIKKQKNWIIGIAIFIIILIIGYATDNSSSSSSNSLYTVNTTTYVATSKSSFDEMFRYINDGDNQALSSLMSCGEVQTLSAGTKVNLISSHFSYCVVRLQGSTSKLWIVIEHITKD